jgi:hypothetical protein
MKKALLLIGAGLLLALSASPQAGTTAYTTAPLPLPRADLQKFSQWRQVNAYRLFALWFSDSAQSNITLQYGTGTNCGTGTGSLSGAMQNVVTFAPPLGPANPITLPVGQAFCINSSVAVTGGGTVIYSRY